MAGVDHGEGQQRARERETRWRQLRRLPFLPPDGKQRLAAWLAEIRLHFGAVFEREMDAGRGFLWLPVFFGIGILVYFALPAEPSALAVAGLAFAIAGAAWCCRGTIGLGRTLLALAAIAFGLTTIKLRTDFASAPVLRHETTATVTGWVEAREGTPSGGARIYLRVASISGVKPAETPYRVRFVLRSGVAGIAVGDPISLKARLQPTSGPVLPGGQDFAFVSFYQRIGGVGFAYGAPIVTDLGPAPLSIRLAEPLAALRETIRERIEAALPGDDGRIAASLIMGDKGPISDKTQNDMRASGLGHVLAIAGLHMALVAGSMFWLVRALLALSPRLALTQPIKKWAAGVALATGLLYVAISGAGIATDRSFIMLAIMLVAVMLDRAALTLRNVAIAAFIILIFWPESLLSVSFQMSFAATVSLIAGYEALRGMAARRPILTDMRHAGLLGWLRQHARTLLMTALLGGIATTPFAAYHFQRVAPLTLIANLAAMPAVTFIVMPMALATAILMPFGLESVPLAIMRYGIEWMTFVASKAAEWSAGIGSVRMIPALALLIAVAGFLWLALWRERWRFAGVPLLLAALPIALLAPQPEILVDQNGLAAAGRGSDGRFQIVGKEDKFEVENWLRADGDPRAANAKAEAGHSAGCDALGCIGKLADGGDVALIRMPDALDEDCRTASVLITRFPPPPGCTARATVIDHETLVRGGSEALYRLPAGESAAAPKFRIESAYPAIHRPYMPTLEPSTTSAAKANAKSAVSSGE